MGKFSRWYGKLIFSDFSQKTGFDIPCKLSSLKTICMKCQNLFSGENKKNISKCCLLKFFPTCLVCTSILLYLHLSIIPSPPTSVEGFQTYLLFASLMCLGHVGQGSKDQILVLPCFPHLSESLFCVALYSEKVNLQICMIQCRTFYRNYLCTKKYYSIHWFLPPKKKNQKFPFFPILKIVLNYAK